LVKFYVVIYDSKFEPKNEPTRLLSLDPKCCSTE